MTKVIDIHSHLGDIFACRKNVIYDLNKADYNTIVEDDPFARHEKKHFEGPLIGPDIKEFEKLTDIGAERGYYNTLENLTKRMDKYNLLVCMHPIHPNISFEDYLAASKLEPRLLPFTSMNYSLSPEQIIDKLYQDVAKGARGLKIHPPLQNIDLSSSKLRKVLEGWEKIGLPVISHCGANNYYYGERASLVTPEFGDVKYFIQLVKDFPNINFIAAHCGGLMGGEMEDLGEQIGGAKNLWVDTTFRSPGDIKKMIKYYGEDKVCFGTDTPFTSTGGSLECVHEALDDNPVVLEKVLYSNAAKLLSVFPNHCK